MSSKNSATWPSNGQTFSKVPFYKHDLGADELSMISEVFSGEILTTGEYVSRFEKAFASILAVEHCLGVNSCTGALHMALLASGIGPGDEVITTPMTFIATANAICETGATPVFVDVEPDTGNLDASRLERAITSRTKAIMPVHLYGLMCDMLAIRKIADAHGLYVIEDAAHCVEGVREGVRPGQLGDFAAFSFFATKNLSCGEGGAITCRTQEQYETLKLLRLHGMTKDSSDRHREGWTPWDMPVLGWKYNMSNIEAAILLPQFDRLERKLSNRQELATRYEELIGGLDGVEVFAGRESTIHARHLFAIKVPKDVNRNVVVSELSAMGVGAVVNYLPVHLMTYYQEKFGFSCGDFEIAEDIGRRTLSLPFYPGMPLDHINQVVERLGLAIAATRTK